MKDNKFRYQFFSWTTVAVVSGALLFTTIAERIDTGAKWYYIPIIIASTFSIGWFLSKKFRGGGSEF